MSAINVSNIAAGSLSRTIYPSSFEERTARIGRKYFPDNKARNFSPLGSDTLMYVNNIRAASASISDALSELSDGFSLTDVIAAESLAAGYNLLFSEAIYSSKDPKAESIASKMQNVSSSHTESLSQIGVEFDQFGLMTIDPEKLDEASENGDLRSFFSESIGSFKGFANQLVGLSANLIHNTTNFISRLDFGNHLTEKFTYTKTGEMTQYNCFSSGLIFDYSF